MVEQVHRTACGEIHYWVDKCARNGAEACDGGVQLVFLPGLTADHRLFDKQVAHFRGRYPLLVWDAPAHAASWPFTFDFDLMDKARWLDEILTREGFSRPILIGQSMGGYVAQAYAELFPTKISGFVSIDSAPLQREFTTAAEIWLLKRMEPVYRLYPWRSLLSLGTRGVSTTDYGRGLMREMMMTYCADKERYVQISGHGMRMLAEAIEADRAYKIECPALLLCGAKDLAGSAKRHNRAWHKRTAIPLVWLKGAGHNSNTDVPDEVNRLIEEFLFDV